jgi:hypothetical protein
MILKVIVKTLFIFVLTIFLLGCDEDKEIDYSDFEGQFITEVSDQLNMPYNDYYVYYYGVYCGACITVKTEVLDAFFYAKNDIIYLVEVEDISSINSETNIKNTPAIIRVIAGEVEETYIGVSEIRGMLDEID